MTPLEVLPYIGLPHEDGATGPYAYDCWGLLRHIQQRYFGVEMPDAPIGDEAACLAMYEEEMVSGRWRTVDVPQHGDGALLRGGLLPHVGTWLDIDGGGILHSLSGSGVIFSNPRNIKLLGFPRVTYYRLKP